MTRTDIHRPKTVEPTDYTLIDVYELSDREGNTDPHYFAKDVETLESRGLRMAEHLNPTYWAGVCGTCGQRGLTYVALMVHKTTGEYMVVGSTCISTTFESARLGLDAKQAAAAQARKEAKLLAGFNAAVAAEPVLAAAVAKLEQMRAIEGFQWGKQQHTLQDIVRKCRQYGNGLSERQTPFVEKLITWADETIERQAKWAAEREAEKTAAVDAPTGRVTVVGKVVTAKWDDYANMGRGALKMLVLADAGFKVWCTAPRALDAANEGLKGKRIQMDINLTPSNDDAAFAFGSRPTKAKFVA